MNTITPYTGPSSVPVPAPVEPPMAELPVEVLDDPKAYEAWLKTLGGEHVAAERAAHEFRVTASDDGQQISLRARQVIAYHAITEGRSLTAAAKEAGVSRMSVHRWMKQDAVFQAALARYKEESVASAREQLQGAVEDAARNLRHAVRQGHLNASVQLLRGLGLLGERKEPAAEPSQRGKVSSRAAKALEERLGQLLSALAQEPRVAGAPETEPKPLAERAPGAPSGEAPAGEDPAAV